jgi:hypothetical protein
MISLFINTKMCLLYSLVYLLLLLTISLIVVYLQLLSHTIIRFQYYLTLEST